MSNSSVASTDLSAAGVLRITLNDPSCRNALSDTMLDKLSSIIADAESNTAVRVIVLAAIGPAFCAGHDLKEMTAHRQDADGGRAYFTKLLNKCSAFMQALVNCPKPVIAEVAGIATAAGCQLVASCDLAVASDNSKFSTPGVHIGLFCSTPMVALSRNVSNKLAMEMLLTGDMVSAKRAEEIGLINKVVDTSILTETVTQLAEKIATKSSMTLATGKKAFYAQREMELADAYSYATQVMVDNMLKKDAVEGIGAFIEKRDPEWQDG